MGVGRDRYFGIANSLARAVRAQFVRNQGEIFSRAQASLARQVDFDEMAKGGEAVPGLQAVYILRGQLAAVARSQAQEGRRGNGPLQVDVQLSLGHGLDKGSDGQKHTPAKRIKTVPPNHGAGAAASSFYPALLLTASDLRRPIFNLFVAEMTTKW